MPSWIVYPIAGFMLLLGLIIPPYYYKRHTNGNHATKQDIASLKATLWQTSLTQAFVVVWLLALYIGLQQ